jgi:serine phosphatase RsbU (regulator of sigma subunit)
LSRKLAEQHDYLLKEQVVAEQIYNRAVTGDNIATKYIRSMMNAVSIFSGDLLLTADCPDGKMHILLGDFTGHGLTAAVGVLPTAEVFRAMTAKGFSAAEILAVINAKLHRMLPTGMFLTACFIVIEKDMRSISVWNAGMPEVLVLGTVPLEENRAAVKHRVTSQYLPLGILGDTDNELVPASLEIAQGDRILLCSDGVTEAVNSSGEVFGMARYEQAATATQHSFQKVASALEEFCSRQPFRDDASLVEVQCVPGLLKAGATQ